MAEAERKPSEPRFRDRFAYRTWVATRSNATGKGPARLSDVWNPPRPLSALLREAFPGDHEDVAWAVAGHGRL